MNLRRYGCVRNVLDARIPISRIPFIFAVVAFVVTFASSRGAALQKAFTVRDSIEAAQFISIDGANPVLLSPDAKRYLVVTVKGDIARNGSRVELLSGSTASLDLASRVSVVARLFSKSTAQTDQLIHNVHWLESGTYLTFLWDSGTAPRRVMTVDLSTGRVTTLASYLTPIVEYDVSRDGKTILFTAQTKHNPASDSTLARTGFAITDQSITSLLSGNLDGWVSKWHFETFLLSPGNKALSKIREPQATWSTTPEFMLLSPDARHAITVRPSAEVPMEWDQYTDHLFKDIYLLPVRKTPQAPNLIRRYVLVDVENATARPLWNAPEYPGAGVVWSPDSKTVAIGPTFLPPPSADASGLAGQAFATVNVETGRYDVLPMPSEFPSSRYRPAHWNIDGKLTLTGTGDHSSPLVFQKARGGRWVYITQPADLRDVAPRVQIEVLQDRNTSPALYAIEPSTQEKRLIEDPNPQLKNLSLAHVEIIHWKATDGRLWTGTLYNPVHDEAGRRVPLVIQTHGYSPNRFQLDGPFTTVFAAQALANRDIAVLQVGAPDAGTSDIVATPEEPKAYTAGFEGAIDALVAKGIVDEGRVGIIGFSRTGWYVEYALSHSATHFAAAEVADNIDGSYVQYTLSGSAARSEFEQDVGAPPQGKGLDRWMANAPGFNTANIRAPLRMEIDSGGFSSIPFQWEIFSSLRYLQRPVELFLIPDLPHGVHLLQNPAQRLASQGGTVDWFCFWLKGEQDPDPAKRVQYQRWLELKALTVSSSGAMNHE